MAYVDFVSAVHTATKRDYLARATQVDKAACAEVAVRFDREYWDGDRDVGYGGYHYDGRWFKVAQPMAQHYDLKPGDRILDVGAGKGYLLYEFTRAVPGVKVHGIDISQYAIENAKEEVKDALVQGDAASLPWPDEHFDFVVSINTLHNLFLPDLWSALQEIERVGRGRKKHITVEGYRNEREKVNLMYWQLTCHAFHTPHEWEWLFAKTGYSGDYGCIFFS